VITATNLRTGDEKSFDDDTTPLWAVCYGHCEEHDRLSELFAAAQEHRVVEFAQTLPVSVGVVSIACGDWAALTGE